MHKVDAAGIDFWLYHSGVTRKPGADIQFPVCAEPKRAAPEDLDRVYAALLAEFVLSEVHHENLRQRGLTDEAIRRAGYGTLPLRGRAAVARKLVERFGADLCAAIPGFYVKDAEANPYWSIAGSAGLLIAVRDPKRRIAALKIRLDDPGDRSRYGYLSSRSHGGPGPGAPVHLPVAASLRARDVRLTEGELKADVATVLSGVPTWSVPGVSAWRGAIPLVHGLGVETVRLAFDGDFATNVNVARGLVRTAEALEKETIARVALETWPATAGKGIDDVLAAGQQPTLHTGTAARRELIRIAAQAGIDTDPRWRARVALEDLLEAQDPAATLQAALQDPLTLDGLARAAELERGPFEAAMQNLQDRGVKAKQIDGLRRAVNAAARDLQREEREEKALALRHRPTGLLCEATDDGLFWLKLTKQGETVREQLTNFVATIISDLQYDDGVERRHVYEIQATLAGKAIARFTVPASQFGILNWVAEHLGAQALIFPGSSTRDRARAVIQQLSEDIRFSTVFVHLGWRRIGGVWAYLHAAGAMGPMGPLPDVEVALEDPLTRYVLPPPGAAADATVAIRAVLQMATIVPAKIGYPLLAATFRAALGRPCAFALHVVGASGIGKSELVALFQQCFGAEMTRKQLPGSWSSTANALEATAFLAKDALFVIDDLAPDGGGHDLDRMHREAARLIRAQGNQSGRGRMRADSSLRPARHPRGLILSTGEDTPRGHSIAARLIVVEMGYAHLDWERLSDCQAEAASGLYSQATTWFVQWLAGRFDAVQARLSSEVIELRDAAAREGQHRRVPDTVAELALGLWYFLDSAVDAGAITPTEREAYWDRGWAALLEVGEAQAALQAAADPVHRFLDLLRAALASGQAHVAGPRGGAPQNASAWGWRSEERDLRAQGDRVGWVDGENLYLDADASYKAAQKMAAGSGEAVPIRSGTLARRLLERGYLRSTEQGRGHLKVRRWIDGVRRDVLHLSSVVFLPREPAPSAPPAPLASESAAAGGFGAIPGADCTDEVTPKAAPERPRAADSRPVGPMGPMGPVVGGETGPSPGGADGADFDQAAGGEGVTP